MEGMILQVISIDESKILLTDGMNNCYLNYSREIETIDILTSSINSSAAMGAAQYSLYVFSDFTFSFDWDYQAKRLIISLNTLDIQFLYPGQFHERIFRSKDLSTVLGQNEKEELKRAVMRRRFVPTQSNDIDVMELLGVTSTGVDRPDTEELALKAGRDKRGAHAVLVDPVGFSNMMGDDEQTTLDDPTEDFQYCLNKNGWLVFPDSSRTTGLPEPGIFPSLAAFYKECNRGLTRLHR